MISTGRADLARTLDRVVCGATWTEGRNDYHKACLWCGAEDTAKHRYWECRRLSTHDDKKIRDTNKLKEAIFPDKEWAQCLWARAILPMTIGRWKEKQTWDEDSEQKCTTNFTELASTNIDMATDDSGGPRYVPDSIRKVGAGIAIVETI